MKITQKKRVQCLKDSKNIQRGVGKGEEGEGGGQSFPENLFVDKINFCTAMVIVVLVLLNSG